MTENEFKPLRAEEREEAGVGTIDDHTETGDLTLIVGGCELGVISDEWVDAYERRKPMLLRAVEHLGVDPSQSDDGLLNRYACRVAASYLLAD